MALGTEDRPAGPNTVIKHSHHDHLICSDIERIQLILVPQDEGGWLADCLPIGESEDDACVPQRIVDAATPWNSQKKTVKPTTRTDADAINAAEESPQ